jgi:hypothetical protein
MNNKHIAQQLIDLVEGITVYFDDSCPPLDELMLTIKRDELELMRNVAISFLKAEKELNSLKADK